MWYGDELWECKHLNVELKPFSIPWISFFIFENVLRSNRSGIPLERRSIGVRIFSHLFSINCDWVQDHPWQIKMKNQLIDEMWCYRFPGLVTHVSVRQTMVTFIQIRSYLSTCEQKNEISWPFFCRNDAQPSRRCQHIWSAQSQWTKADFSCGTKMKMEKITKIVIYFRYLFFILSWRWVWLMFTMRCDDGMRPEPITYTYEVKFSVHAEAIKFWLYVFNET